MTTADPLSVVLDTFRFHGAGYGRLLLGAPWALEVVPYPEQASFVVVEAGRLFVETEGESGAEELGPGDAVVLPHGGRHTFRDATGTARETVSACALLGECQASPRGSVRHGGDGGRTALFAGGYLFESVGTSPLLDALPPRLTLRAGTAGAWVGPALAALTRAVPFAGDTGELDPDALPPRLDGSDALAARLAEALFVEAVRAYLTRLAGDEAGGVCRASWLRGLAHPRVGAGLAAIHREPARDWSVDDLAREAAMSRAAFAATFSDVVGVSPYLYLTRWRIHRAAAMLRRTDETVAAVAAEVGYASASAFSKAFSRETGQSPQAFRALA